MDFNTSLAAFLLGAGDGAYYGATFLHGEGAAPGASRVHKDRLLFSFNFFPMIKYLRPAAVHSDSNCCLGLQDKGWSEPAWDGVRPEYVLLLPTYALLQKLDTQTA